MQSELIHLKTNYYIKYNGLTTVNYTSHSVNNSSQSMNYSSHFYLLILRVKKLEYSNLIQDNIILTQIS